MILVDQAEHDENVSSEDDPAVQSCGCSSSACDDQTTALEAARVPLLPRLVVTGRSTSFDAVASTSASLVADCSPDRRSL